MKNEAENRNLYTAKGNKNNKVKDLVKESTYKSQHLSQERKRTLKDKVKNLVKDLQYHEPQHLNSEESTNRGQVRNLRSKPAKSKSKRFVARGKMRFKMKALIAIALAGIAATFISTCAKQTDFVKDSGDSSIVSLKDSGVIMQNESKEFDDIFFNSAVAIGQDILNEQDNKLEDEQVVEKETEQENKIKTIYGGEISASENGVRTADEIIHAVTQMGWREAEIENVREMMDGLLRMQSDFDIDPLCALAVFHHESMCGLAYEQYGQYRLANILRWTGQEGVIGYSKSGSYGLYSDYNSAVYDFGNYVRNSSALKGAKTMADLESFNGYACIFNGAATADAHTYNRLKQCLEQEFSDLEVISSDKIITNDVVGLDAQQILNSVVATSPIGLNSEKDSQLDKEKDTNYKVSSQNEIYQLGKESKQSVDGTDIGLASQVGTTSSQAKDSKLRDDIKTVYGGEISASKNGMRTEDEIIHAVTQMGWQDAEIENVVEMLDGLMRIQKDFDIDPLCALAVFHHESTCGLAYEKYGQYRLANILHWPGEKGVIGYSKSGSYGLYNDYNSAVYDFANYVRNSSALKGAKTMADLESFNGYACIFNGAATADAATYEKLKKCLEKDYTSEVDMDDIYKIVEGCTTNQVQEMTIAVKSNFQEVNTRNQGRRGEHSER